MEKAVTPNRRMSRPKVLKHVLELPTGQIVSRLTHLHSGFTHTRADCKLPSERTKPPMSCLETWITLNVRRLFHACFKISNSLMPLLPEHFSGIPSLRLALGAGFCLPRKICGAKSVIKIHALMRYLNINVIAKITHDFKMIKIQIEVGPDPVVPHARLQYEVIYKTGFWPINTA